MVRVLIAVIISFGQKPLPPEPVEGHASTPRPPRASGGCSLSLSKGNASTPHRPSARKEP
jgi:hypothetical protein